VSELGQLEARLRRLEEIEAIKRLKYRYLRCLDSKLWDELAECFAEDAITAYAGGTYAFQGRDAIMKFLRESLATSPSMHLGHHPEIELTSDTTATGTWQLCDHLIRKDATRFMTGMAFYHDEYVKIDGEWKIKSTGYDRMFEESWHGEDLPSLKVKAGT